MSTTDPRERASILQDLASSDEEVRRLAIERAPLLPVAEALPILVGGLGDASWRVRKSAVECLVRAPEDWPVAGQLIEALADGENPGRRNAAVEALVRIGRRMVEPLLAAAASPDVDVRKLVVDALAGIGSERAVPRLVEMLGDPDPNVQAAAVDALGAIGGAEAVRALSALAMGETRETLVRFSALRALARLETPLPAAALREALADPVLRPVAFAVLGHGDEPEALDALLAGFSTTSRAAREAAIEALLRMAGRADPARAQAIHARMRDAARAAPACVTDAIARLADGELGVRLMLVQFLGVVRAPESVVPLLGAARDEALTEVVLDTLAGFGEPVEALLDQRWTALDVEVRALACELLGRGEGACGAARLSAALDDADPLVRIAAAGGLARRGDPSALRALLRRLETTAGDLEPETQDEREALTRALVEIARTAAAEVRGSMLELLAGGLEGAVEPVRLAVARVLREVAGPEHAPHMPLLVQDPSPAVRRAAVAALARMGGGLASEMLHLALADEDAAVRSAAALALGESADAGTVADLERLLADEDVGVRAAAVQALSALPPALLADAEVATRVEKLLGGALYDVAPVAIAAVEAFERMGGALSLEPVRGVIGHRDPEVVQSAVRCLQRHGSEEDVHALLPLLGHSHWAVRADVIQAFAERNVRAALPAVLRRLELEQDQFVRDVLLRALARLEEA